MKYKLTIGQRLLIPFLWVWRLNAIAEGREVKTWHEVKKSMERHTHEYTIPMKIGEEGIREEGWFRCSHEGCNMVCPPEIE